MFINQRLVQRRAAQSRQGYETAHLQQQACRIMTLIDLNLRDFPVRVLPVWIPNILRITEGLILVRLKTVRGFGPMRMLF